MAARLVIGAKEQEQIVDSLNFEQFLLEESLTFGVIQLLQSPILGWPQDRIPHATFTSS